jgi:hypothetical protein
LTLVELIAGARRKAAGKASRSKREGGCEVTIAALVRKWAEQMMCATELPDEANQLVSANSCSVPADFVR